MEDKKKQYIRSFIQLPKTHTHTHGTDLTNERFVMSMCKGRPRNSVWNVLLLIEQNNDDDDHIHLQQQQQPQHLKQKQNYVYPIL